jgi:hypothetical protein
MRCGDDCINAYSKFKYRFADDRNSGKLLPDGAGRIYESGDAGIFSPKTVELED